MRAVMCQLNRRKRLLTLLLGVNVVVIGYLSLTVPRYTSATEKGDETRTKPTAKAGDGKRALENAQKPRKIGVASNHMSPVAVGQTSKDLQEIEPGVLAKEVSNAPVAKVFGRQSELPKKVLTRLGFSEFKPGHGDLDFLWTYDFPLAKLKEEIETMKPTAKINHIPHTAVVTYTRKQELAEIPLNAIPKAFRIPREKEAFLNFTKQHPEMLWVQKKTSHEGVEIKSPGNIALKRNIFAQEYIANPLLIDGRFCPKRYYPFTPTDTETYVVRHGYKTTVQIPELAKIYHSQNGTYRQAFNTYFRNQGVDVDIMWEKVYSIIRKVVVYIQAGRSVQLTERIQLTTRQLFELVRFDFLLDENWNIYLMEVNRSPALTPSSPGLTSEMYQHVIYSTLRLVGVAAMAENKDSDMPTDGGTEVFQDWCGGTECRSDRNKEVVV